MHELDARLHRALGTAVDAAGRERVITRAREVSALYRTGRAPARPVIDDHLSALAYATSRMPATYAAIRTVLEHAWPHLPAAQPRTHLDIGGGTGAAVWAVADVWPGIASTVIEQSPTAAALGRELLDTTQDSALRGTRWTEQTLEAGSRLPRAELITVSYLLGELPETIRSSLLAQLCRVGEIIVLVEPGTPAGHRRILEARSVLLASGLAIAAPCPHEHTCPLGIEGDWCHFSARLSRSTVLREAKSAERNYEDEKYSYLVAARRTEPAAGRIVRRPTYRKGQVLLEVCGADAAARRLVVTKREGQGYRRARKAEWGDPWPPPHASPSAHGRPDGASDGPQDER